MFHITHNKITNIIWFTLLIIPILSNSELSAADNTWTMFIGMEYARPHFSIDHHVNVGGDDVHFFTSRHIDYLGWYFKVNYYRPLSRNFGYGYTGAMGLWETGYWLNWEMPDYGVSLDPLKSELTCIYFDIGIILYGRWGPLNILPFLAVPIGYTSFSLTIEDEVESGDASYFGLDGGVEAQLQLSKTVSLTIGYKTTKLINSSPSYEVEEDVELKGMFHKMPEEFYFGVSFSVK